MSDDNILPLNGGDAPDDLELKARMISAYQNTPVAEAGAVARCVRVVLERASAGEAVPAASSISRRHWMLGTAAIAAALLLSVTLRTRTPVAEQSAANAVDVANATPIGATVSVDGGVKFDLRLPKGLAANVSVVGDFNGWDASATPMVKGGTNGEWSAKVALLPGRHVYAYVVNGKQWVVDPLAPQIPDVGYGPANAVVVEEGAK
ncbi:MAG: isoamylase early set domain-containing protein [Gemmatimonadaceae bacterium]